MAVWKDDCAKREDAKVTAQELTAQEVKMEVLRIIDEMNAKEEMQKLLREENDRDIQKAINILADKCNQKYVKESEFLELKADYATLLQSLNLMGEDVDSLQNDVEVLNNNAESINDDALTLCELRAEIVAIKDKVGTVTRKNLDVRFKEIERFINLRKELHEMQAERTTIWDWLNEMGVAFSVMLTFAIPVGAMGIIYAVMMLKVFLKGQL